jgi:hypothetical protein
MRELLRDYARQTRAGNRGTAAAWQRLQRALDDVAPNSAPRAAVAPPGGTGARWLGAAFAAGLMLWIAGGVLPSRAARRTDLRATTGPSVSAGVGPGGAPGSGAPGCGGAEGSSGNHAGRGETAAASMPRVDPLRAG